MALIGEGYIDGIKIQCKIIGPVRNASVPTLQFEFTFYNNKQHAAILVPFIYEVELENPPPKMYLGKSVAFPFVHGLTSFASIPSRDSCSFASNFELGYHKVGIIKERVKKDLFLTVRVDGTLFIRRNNTLVEHSFGAEIRPIKVPASEWIDWLSAWVKELRTLTISGELGGKLDVLKEQMKIVSDQELITELYEHYPKPSKEE